MKEISSNSNYLARIKGSSERSVEEYKDELFGSPFDDLSSSLMDSFPLPSDQLQQHGTTTLSFIWNDTIIVAVDSRASIGNYVGSRTTKKIFPINSHTVATMAGGAADCTYWIRRTARQAKFLEYQYNSPLSVKSIAKILADSLREHRGRDLSVATMVAGLDCTGSHIYFVDSQGNCIPGKCFCVGSGSNVAWSILDDKVDALHQDVNATLKDALDIALWAVRHATHRDGFSGGYINIFVIDEKGYRHVLRKDSKSLLV